MSSIINPYINELVAYSPPQEARHQKDALYLDFNESNLPPHPQIKQALQQALDDGINRYPASRAQFMDALSTHVGLESKYLLATNGADQALELALKAVIEKGDKMIFPLPGFSFIEILGRLNQAIVVRPLCDEHFNLPDLSLSIDEQTKLVVIINPNNPTGKLTKPAVIEKLLASYPQTAFIVDEAYHEFSGVSVCDLVQQHANLIIVRTFSKVFGLAGLRLGYIIAQPQLIKALSKLQGPFDVNSFALIAGKVALECQEWKNAVNETMLKAKPILDNFLIKQQIKHVKSCANFVLVKDSQAEMMQNYFAQHNVFIRRQGEPINDYVRISIGTQNDMQRLIKVYQKWLDEPSASIS